MSPLPLHRTAPYSAADLVIDPAREVERICADLRAGVRADLRRRGLVLGLSGGVDSSVCAALAARALGPQNVLALLMPEHDSDPDSLALGREVAEAFEIPYLIEDIAPALAALGCYERRDKAIRSVEPAYGEGWSCKVVIANPLDGGYAVSSLVTRSPSGREERHRLTAQAYLALIAATNMKQRTRKQIEYHHADRMNFAVLGTPNRLEYDQGFFVKNGDGAADIKPIAHLYKSQVYQLADWLGVPEAVVRRPPTTDTWSLPQTQEEFYFALPYERMDLCLYGLDKGIAAEAVAEAAGLTPDQVSQVWRDIAGKRRATRYLHREPLLVEDIPLS